jgi:hypothetical protein
MSSKRWNVLAVGVAGLLGICGAAVGQNPCTLLSPSQIDEVLGAAVGGAQPVGTTMCQWSVAGQPNSIQGKKVAVVLLTAQGYANAKAPVNAASITKTPIPGVGDEAVYGTTAGKMASLSVKKGNSYFSVRVTGYPMAQLQHMETVLAQEIAAAL